MRKYRDVLGADQTESGMGTRDWSYSLSQKKVSYTALALWECVKQLKHFENKKKMSWQPQLWELCDNLRMLKWWYDLSNAAKAAVIGGRFWRWTLRRYFVTKFKQFNLFSKSRYNVSQHHWEAVSNNHRICCQVWLYINYEAENGYHYYLRSIISFLMFPESCPWMRVKMDGETDM